MQIKQISPKNYFMMMENNMKKERRLLVSRKIRVCFPWYAHPQFLFTFIIFMRPTCNKSPSNNVLDSGVIYVNVSGSVRPSLFSAQPNFGPAQSQFSWQYSIFFIYGNHHSRTPDQSLYSVNCFPFIYSQKLDVITIDQSVTLEKWLYI